MTVLEFLARRAEQLAAGGDPAAVDGAAAQPPPDRPPVSIRGDLGGRPIEYRKLARQHAERDRRLVKLLEDAKVRGEDRRRPRA